MQPTNLTPGTARACVALLAPLLLCPPAAAALCPDEPTPAAQDEDTRALRRIVHLTSGSTVRGVVRRGEDGWEVKQGGAWQRLPLAAIERIQLERDALAEWRKRQRSARKDGLEARAQLGAWSFENGLLEEGLGTLERVLEDHADQPTALAAITGHAHRFAVPRVEPRAEDGASSTDELRRWAAGRGRTTRELAVLELARVRDRDGLEGALARDLFAGSFRRRAFAAHALRRLFPGHEVERLVHRAVLDGADQVREQAAYALRDAGKVGVIVPVARAMESSHHRVRTQAAEALGNMGYPSAVEPLMARLAAVQGAGEHNVPHSYIFVGTQFAYIQDFKVEVAQFQAAADPEVNILVQGNVLEAGVHGVKEVQFTTEGRAIRSALEKLTGADPGNTNRAWLRWWEENADGWRATARADDAPRTRTTD